MVKTTGPPTLVRRPRFDHMESRRLASCLFTMDWRIKIFEAHLFLVHVLTPKPQFLYFEWNATMQLTTNAILHFYKPSEYSPPVSSKTH